MENNQLSYLFGGESTKTKTTTPQMYLEQPGNKIHRNAMFPRSKAGEQPIEQPIEPVVAPAVPATSMFQGAQQPAPISDTQIQPEGDLYEKYRDPKTGEIMSPDEYATSLANKIPRGTGQIPNYAGDAMTDPNQSAEGLTTRARNLSNTRNDMAVGEADPYGVGNKSGIAYSPRELKAIESAYSGIYDPALNDVFSRLQDKKSEDAKKASEKEAVFKTNEAIRKWKATTGSKVSNSSSSSSSNGSNNIGDGSSDVDISKLFSKTQLNNAARNARLDRDDILGMDENLVNFFIKPTQIKDEETGKMHSANNTFDNVIRLVSEGQMSSAEARVAIEEENVHPAVMHYYISKIPEATDEDISEEEERTWYQEIWHRLPFVN